MKKKKKAKKCSYYAGEQWKTKKQQKKDIDKLKEMELVTILMDKLGI